MKEISSLRLSRITAEQMTALAGFYNERFSLRPNESSTVALLSFLASEGIDIFVAEYFFFKKGHNARVLENDEVQVLFVSKQKIPDELKVKLKNARQELIHVLEEGDIENIQESYKLAQTEVEMLQAEANKLPAYFQVWLPKPPKETEL